MISQQRCSSVILFFNLQNSSQSLAELQNAALTETLLKRGKATMKPIVPILKLYIIISLSSNLYAEASVQFSY